MARDELFSPGPWKLEPREDCPGFRLENADGELIDYLNESRYIDGRFDHEQRANLDLIKRAPELFQLIRDCEESFTADESYPLLRQACRKLLGEIEGIRAEA